MMSLFSVREMVLVPFAALVFALLFSYVRRAFQRRALRARFSRARSGEERARMLLEAKGFRITAAQALAHHTVLVDRKTIHFELRADYFVKKNGRSFVAEVKTGALAPRLDTSATRRQLLEYSVAFDVDGVLLVDAESGKILEIAFPTLNFR